MAIHWQSPSFFIFIVFTVARIHGSADHVLEDGYVVRTVLDGHKLEINPYSVLPRYGSSDFIILDSQHSLFYTVSSPISQESEIKRFAGTSEGFKDGDSASAMFERPRNFAIDLKGNVYVADKGNKVIRKITNRGVTTTIAGGYEQKPGKVDGPAQNASFSPDFDLVFVPEICALLVSDRGNGLIRQIDMKAEDCRRSPDSVLGGASFWVILGLGISCFVGFIVGLVLRPYVIPHEGFSPLFSETWKHCLIHLGKQVVMFSFDIRSVIASSMLYAFLRRIILLSLAYLSLMFRINNVQSQFSQKESVSLLDSNNSCISEPIKREMLTDQLKDLLPFDGSSELSNASEQILKEGDNDQGWSGISPKSCGRIDSMIAANIIGFAEQAKFITPVEPCSSGATGLVKRR